MTTVIWTAQLAGVGRSWDPVKLAGALRPMTHTTVEHPPGSAVIPYRPGKSKTCPRLTSICAFRVT